MARKSRMEGDAAVKKRLGTIQRAVREKRVAAVVRGMLGIKRDSMMNCPVREGNLRASAFVVMPYGEEGISGTFTGETAGNLASTHASAKATTLADVIARTRKGLSAAVGHSAVYALFVHELPTAGAPGYDPTKDTIITRGARKGKRRRAEEVHSKVGGWKFLENAIKKNQGRIRNLLKNASAVGIQEGAKR